MEQWKGIGTDFVVGLKQSATPTGQGVRLNAFSATEQTLMAAADTMARGTPFSGPGRSLGFSTTLH
jgi:hypothetical protein